MQRSPVKAAPNRAAAPAPTTRRTLPRIVVQSLVVKLTVAFLVVGLLGALLVSVFVRQGTERAFDQFVRDRESPKLTRLLSDYHTTNGSWDGVDRVFDAYWTSGEFPVGTTPPDPVVVDATYTVVQGDDRFAVGTQLTPDDMQRSTPIIEGTTVIGWLLDQGQGRKPNYGSPENDFIQRVSLAITYSAIGATAIALLLGIVLAQTLTRPLRELTAATQRVARGMLGQQVVVRSRDELGVLAASFNQMSADLQHASTLRRQMTADIAHDLRTPLSVILGYTEALRDNKLPPEQDIFDTLHTEAQHLQHLINDLRTLSLADAGELPLARQVIRPATLIDRIATTYRAQAQAKAITVEAVNDAGDVLIDVDVERMAQVLGNLFANALRFTPQGGTIRLLADTHADLVRLKVADTGTGIDPQDLPHVFERFYRADVARQQGDGSSGLGLAIARGIVEAHGGTIVADSEPGKGTTFTITLPRTEAVEQPEFA